MTTSKFSRLPTIAIIGIFLAINSLFVQVGPNSSIIASTDRYEFHSNFWINMHHFLYKKAEQAEEKPWRDAFEDQVIDRMNNDEQEVLGNSIQFYKDNLIDKNLLFNDQLYWTKRALIKFEANDVLDHEALETKHQQILNSAKSRYAKYFWVDHHGQNKLILKEYLSLIKKTENNAFERIAEFAQQPWPEGKVRVDLSYYSNWAGAYTTVRPIHVVISSREEGSEGKWPDFGWLELLFHEPTHAVVSADDFAVAEAIREISEELDVDIPRNLWHAILFYFSGKAVQELLEEEGIEYELLMVSYDIFSRFHTPVFEYMPQYVQGNESLEESLRKVIAGLND